MLTSSHHTVPREAEISAPSGTGARLTAIDGFRGIAISAVVFHHLFQVHIARADPSLFGIDLTFLLTSGWLGVNLFFVLSGFVLFLPYRMGTREFSRPDNIVGFYRHRAARLFPAYYFCVLAILGLQAGNGLDDVKYLREVFGLLTWTFPFMPDLYSPPANWALCTSEQKLVS